VLAIGNVAKALPLAVDALYGQIMVDDAVDGLAPTTQTPRGPRVSRVLESLDVGFTAEDCAVFDRYPKAVRWPGEVAPPDREIFMSVWEKLKRLATWLASTTTSEAGGVAMRGFTSRYQPSGRSTHAIWCCIYPKSAHDKSYALQVALIISAAGAEVCICRGAGRIEFQRDGLTAAEFDLQKLQSSLAEIPPEYIRQVEASLPSGAMLRRSWRCPPSESEFSSLREWIAFASSPEGAQASISLYFSVTELDRLGTRIGDVIREMAFCADPLFIYCYADPPIEFHEEEETGESQTTEIRQSVDFDAGHLQALAEADPHKLLLDPAVYRAIAAAIRSHKHVILTGPPGTAKTTLAEIACDLAGSAKLCEGYELTTATADWTTYDTIGGLRPAGSGTSLEFRDGILLEAIQNRRWVIIDELNRSNFDRAFGQLFTVLSGQSVVLPFDDRESGRRIALCLEGVNVPYRISDYERIMIPNNWRIIATMNVFDKSLLFEMSFALMRRFAFIEVPSPSPEVFEDLWRRELQDVVAEKREFIERILRSLLELKIIKDIGPAVFIDMARFAREYLNSSIDVSPGQLAFQLFYSYLLPQYEGIDPQLGRELFERVGRVTGSVLEDKLARTLTEVLGIPLLPGRSVGAEDVDVIFPTAP